MDLTQGIQKIKILIIMNIRFVVIILLALTISGPVKSQEKNKRKAVMTGKVVNRDSIPVSDVMIFIDGKNTNRVTDKDGEFKLRLKPDVEKISFYSPGDGVFEIDYLGQERVEIIMNHDANIITTYPEQQGEVVEIGYGKVEDDKRIGSVSSITSDRFKNRSYRNVYEMIVGEASGVTVEGKSIRIRGISSLHGSNDPLLIVDGSPVVSFDHISPSDVESISVLKGSSTAIYGTRGAAGVIVVNTKTGRK